MSTFEDDATVGIGSLASKIIVGISIVGIFTAMLTETCAPEVAFLYALVVVIMTGILDLPTALSGFSNESLITIGALYFVIAAVEKSYIVDFLARKAFGVSPIQAVGTARMYFTTLALSSVFNNTPLVAVMIPVVRDWGRVRGIALSQLLIPLSYAAVAGGLLTMIGTSTNLTVQGLVKADHGFEFSFFSPAFVCLPAGIVLGIYIVIAAPYLLPKKSGLIRELRDKASELVMELEVTEDSDFQGSNLGALCNGLGLSLSNVLKIRRKNPNSHGSSHGRGGIAGRGHSFESAAGASWTSANRFEKPEGLGSTTRRRYASEDQEGAAVDSQFEKGISLKDLSLKAAGGNNNKSKTSNSSSKGGYVRATDDEEHDDDDTSRDQRGEDGTGTVVDGDEGDASGTASRISDSNYVLRTLSAWGSIAKRKTFTNLASAKGAGTGDSGISTDTSAGTGTGGNTSGSSATADAQQNNVVDVDFRGNVLVSLDELKLKNTSAAAAATTATATTNSFKANAGSAAAAAGGGDTWRRLASTDYTDIINPTQFEDLHEGDILFVANAKELITKLMKTLGNEKKGLRILESNVTDIPGFGTDLAEVVLSHQNPFLGRNLSSCLSEFNDKYRVAVISTRQRTEQQPAEQPNGARLRSQLRTSSKDMDDDEETCDDAADASMIPRASDSKSMILATGDVLLCLSKDVHIKDLLSNKDFYVVSLVGSVPKPVTLYGIIPIFIFIAGVIVVATGQLSMCAASLTLAAIFFAGGWIKSSEIATLVDLKLLMLMGCALSFAKAMGTSGLAADIASIVTSANAGPTGSLFIVYILTCMITSLVSNNAAAVLMYPFAVAVADGLGVSFKPFVYGVMIAASAAFMSPLGYQTHLMVWLAGGYTFFDFVKFGLVPNIIFCLATCLMAPLVYPF